MNVQQAIETRRSIRTYEARDVERDSGADSPTAPEWRRPTEFSAWS